MTNTKNAPVSLNEMLFPVEMLKNEMFECNSDYAYDILAYPNSDNKPLRVNVCSNRYELVPNDQIFPEIERIFNESGINFSVRYYMIDYARFYAEYTIEDKQFAYIIPGSNGDVIKPMLRVQHSYNGLTKYSINFGYFRLVCSNGLTIPVEEMKEYNLSIIGKHTANIKNSFDQLQTTLQYFADNVDQISLAITGRFADMSGKMVVNVDDRIAEVLKVANITAVDNKNFNTVDYIKDVINSEVNLYGGVTNDWLIYNAINRYIFDDTLNRKAPEIRQTLDSKVLEAMVN